MSSEVADSTINVRATKRSNALTRLAFQEQYHSTIMAVMPSILADYIQDLRTSTDLEDRRKGLVYLSQIVGVEVDKKQDVGSGRAVVTINFGGAGAPQQVTIEQDVQEVQSRPLTVDDGDEGDPPLPPRPRGRPRTVTPLQAPSIPKPTTTDAADFMALLDAEMGALPLCIRPLPEHPVEGPRAVRAAAINKHIAEDEPRGT